MLELVDLFYPSVLQNFAGPLAVLALIVLFRLRPLLRGRRREDAVEMTTLAKLSGHRAGQFDPITKLAQRGEGETTLGETILRPSLLMRLFSFGLTGLFVALLFLDIGAPYRAGFDDWMILLIAVGAIYGFFYVQLAEVRYDRDVIIGRDGLFRRKENRWADLVRVQDDGQYSYILTFADGSKQNVQKQSKGGGAFLTYARKRLAANLKGEALPQPRIRPGASVFGEKKTFY